MHTNCPGHKLAGDMCIRNNTNTYTQTWAYVQGYIFKFICPTWKLNPRLLSRTPNRPIHQGGGQIKKNVK